MGSARRRADRVASAIRAPPVHARRRATGDVLRPGPAPAGAATCVCDRPVDTAYRRSGRPLSRLVCRGAEHRYRLEAGAGAPQTLPGRPMAAPARVGDLDHPHRQRSRRPATAPVLGARVRARPSRRSCTQPSRHRRGGTIRRGLDRRAGVSSRRGGARRAPAASPDDSSRVPGAGPGRPARSVDGRARRGQVHGAVPGTGSKRRADVDAGDGRGTPGRHRRPHRRPRPARPGARGPCKGAWHWSTAR